MSDGCEIAERILRNSIRVERTDDVGAWYIIQDTIYVNEIQKLCDAGVHWFISGFEHLIYVYRELLK
ncbi:MAG: hypothetical protein N2V78_09505 [Methanophagales archaeon]|nr:hypothetical protein [Methanophagales archaeon]